MLAAGPCGRRRTPPERAAHEPARGVPGAHRRRRAAARSTTAGDAVGRASACPVRCGAWGGVVTAAPVASGRSRSSRRADDLPGRARRTAGHARPHPAGRAAVCLLAPLAFVIAMGLVDTVPVGHAVRTVGQGQRHGSSVGGAGLCRASGASRRWCPWWQETCSPVRTGTGRGRRWSRRSTTRGRVFAAKTVAATGVGLLLVVLLGVQQRGLRAGSSAAHERAGGPVRPAARRGRPHRPGRAGLADPAAAGPRRSLPSP